MQGDDAKPEREDMKITISILTTTSRHGDTVEVFPSPEAAWNQAEKYCRETWWYKDVPADLHGKELVEFCLYDENGIAGGDDNISLTSEEITLVVPSDPVAAARFGYALLALARDCFKSVRSIRTVKRIREALSSAAGAVRHAENKAAR
jgi:hypothetical protein